jgi:hypothetical protein
MRPDRLIASALSAGLLLTGLTGLAGAATPAAQRKSGSVPAPGGPYSYAAVDTPPVNGNEISWTADLGAWYPSGTYQSTEPVVSSYAVSATHGWTACSPKPIDVVAGWKDHARVFEVYEFVGKESFAWTTYGGTCAPTGGSTNDYGTCGTAPCLTTKITVLLGDAGKYRQTNDNVRFKAKS